MAEKGGKMGIRSCLDCSVNNIFAGQQESTIEKSDAYAIDIVVPSINNGNSDSQAQLSKCAKVYKVICYPQGSVQKMLRRHFCLLNGLMSLAYSGVITLESLAGAALWYKGVGQQPLVLAFVIGLPVIGVISVIFHCITCFSIIKKIESENIR